MTTYIGNEAQSLGIPGSPTVRSLKKQTPPITCWYITLHHRLNYVKHYMLKYNHIFTPHI